jgi:uncharacterized OB-fold protein
VSTPLRITVCVGCGTAAWPPRARCPVCGSGDWSVGDGSRGRAEQTTDVVGDPTVRLATVRLDAGPVVVARADGVAAGATVTLQSDDGALVARTANEEDR